MGGIKTNYIRRISILFCTLVGLNVVYPVTNNLSVKAQIAQEDTIVSNTMIFHDDIGMYVKIDSDRIYLYDNNQERVVASGVAIFLGGILVGGIADGVVIYATGHSGGEWVARALSYLAKYPNAKSIYLSKLDCSVYPINSQF